MLISKIPAANRRTGVTIHFPAGQGPMALGQRRLLQRIAPDLCRAFALGFHHQAMLDQRFWDGVTLRDERAAALLFDERGRILRATDAALAIGASDDGLNIAQGRLSAGAPADAMRLGTLIGRAVAPSGAASGAMSIQRRSGRRPYVVVAYPLARASRALAPLEAAALVRIVDLYASNDHSTNLYREAFHLTVREAELAAALMAGHSVESAAASLKMSLPTARTHLRRLFEKTATTGQPAMLRLLPRISDA